MYSKESEFDRIEPKKDNLKQEQLDKNYLEKKYQTETSGEEDSTINLGIKIQLNNKPIDEKKMNFEKQESNDRIDSKKELNRTYSSNQLIQKSSQPNLSNSNSDQVAKEVKIINSMIPDQSRLRRKSSDTITIDQGCFIILGIILINVISLLVFFLLVYFECKFRIINRTDLILKLIEIPINLILKSSKN